MDNMNKNQGNTAEKGRKAAPEKKNRLALKVTLIVIASVIALLLIVGFAFYFILQNIYNAAFYSDTVDIVDRNAGYVMPEFEGEGIIYAPNRLLVETDRTVYYQGDKLSSDGVVVKLLCYDGSRYVETVYNGWWYSEEGDEATKNVGKSECTIRARIKLGVYSVDARLKMPITVIERPEGVEGSCNTKGEVFKGSVDFSGYTGGNPYDVLSVYSQETIDAIKDGHLDLPIYKKEQIDKDVQNILIVGQGDTTDGNAIDYCETIIVVSYNKKTNSVTVTSLLSDTLVPIEGYGWNRLGVAYRIGGVGLLINTINSVYGLDIQYFVEADIKLLVEFVDRLGGVTLNVTENQIESLALVNCTPGENVISGDNLHNWLVYGGAGVDDLSRTDRQGAVIRRLISDYLTGEKSIKDLVDICLEKKFVVTNLSFPVVFEIGMKVLTDIDGFGYTYKQLPDKIGDPYNFCLYKGTIVGIRIAPADLQKMAYGVFGYQE